MTVIEFFKKIKHEYIEKFGSDYEYDNTTCIEYWIDRLDNDEYKKMIEPLMFKEYKHFLLIHYDSMYFKFIEKYKITVDEFWDLYGGLYRQCRSVVIDIDKEKIALYPFDKFFNINELKETNIDIVKNKIENAHKVEFSEKLDGSFFQCRYYDGDFVCSTSMALDPNNSWRLTDAIQMLEKIPTTMFKVNDSCTFMFEYISQQDAHVVKYKEDQSGLYLIGIRNEQGFLYDYETTIRIATVYHIQHTNIIDKTFDQIISELDDVPSNEAEGFVLHVDNDRYKIKYNDYVLMHRTLSSLTSPNAIIKEIAENNIDDFISKIPEAYKEEVNLIIKKIYAYRYSIATKIDEYMAMYGQLDKKEFMIAIDNNCPQNIRHFVKCKYCGRDFNILKPNGYIKYREICDNE